MHSDLVDGDVSVDSCATGDLLNGDVATLNAVLAAHPALLGPGRKSLYNCGYEMHVSIH